MSKSFNHHQLVTEISDLLKEFDLTRPVAPPKPGRKPYKPGIGPFDEPDLVKEIAIRLSKMGVAVKTEEEVDRVKNIDMVIGNQWAVEFKTARAYNNTGTEAEHWSENLTHPYPGHVSAIGDVIKLQKVNTVAHKCVLAIGFERDAPPGLPLEPVFHSFEVIAEYVMDLSLGPRIEVTRSGLVHPVHQTLRCASWEVR